jgi:hypothetical protein
MGVSTSLTLIKKGWKHQLPALAEIILAQWDAINPHTQQLLAMGWKLQEGNNTRIFDRIGSYGMFSDHCRSKLEPLSAARCRRAAFGGDIPL